MGRWSSPDPSELYFADPANPQTLNLYAYVGNQPTGYIDPNGFLTCGSGGAAPAGVNQVGAAVVGFFHAIGCGIQNLFGGGGSSGDGGESSPSGQSGAEPGFNLYPSASALRFPSLNMAGIAASRAALTPTSQADAYGHKFEYGGRLLRNKNGQFTFTNPVTFNNDHLFWSSHVMVPFGYKKVGNYHTHPQGSIPGMSSADAQSSENQQVPEFMGEERPYIGPAGRVWKYSPGQGCDKEPCGSIIFDPNQQH